MPDSSIVARTHMNEFKYDRTQATGRTIFVAPHELWNEIEISFPPEYFGAVIPKTVWAGIEILKPEEDR